MPAPTLVPEKTNKTTMPKNPYPYSAQIVAKTIKDWQHVDFNSFSESEWPDEVWVSLSTKADNPIYSLKYRQWAEDFLCCPSDFENDVSFDDKQKLGEKLIKPYLTWKKEKSEKLAKAKQKKEKREHAKKLKIFLAS